MIADADDARMFAAFEAAGQVRRFPGWVEWCAPQFEVASGTAVQIGLDGEALTMDPPLIFASRRGALWVRLPRHALQVSAAARTVQMLSGSAIAQLARVAIGQPDTPQGTAVS